MISEKQLEANRANSQKSTGPRTAEGKKRSSLNGTRHGLTGQVHVLPEEDLIAFNNFTKGIVESLEAHGANELQLGQSYAGYQWRINRIGAIEETILTLGLMEENAENLNIEHAEIHNATSYAKTFRSQAATFDRLSLYNQRLENTAAKVLKQLKEMQAERRRREHEEMTEATRLYQFHRMQSQPFDPQANGFAFSMDQIKAHIRRQNYRQQAMQAEKLGYDNVSWVKKYGKMVA
jgi:transcription termination factor NusB